MCPILSDKEAALTRIYPIVDVQNNHEILKIHANDVIDMIAVNVKIFKILLDVQHLRRLLDSYLQYRNCRMRNRIAHNEAAAIVHMKRK